MDLDTISEFARSLRTSAKSQLEAAAEISSDYEPDDPEDIRAGMEYHAAERTRAADIIDALLTVKLVTTLAQPQRTALTHAIEALETTRADRNWGAATVIRDLLAASPERPPIPQEVLDHCWNMYQQGQAAASSKEAFAQTLRSLSEWLCPSVDQIHGPYDVIFMGAGVWAGIVGELPGELAGKKVFVMECRQ